MSMTTVIPVFFRIGLAGTLFSMLICLSLASAEDPIQAEIAHLLAFVRSSECVFIRNGKNYEGHDAETHIKRKYNHFKDLIATAEDFIQLTATRSTLSGQVYMVHCGEREIPSGTWLQTELKAFRSRASKEGMGVAD